MSDQCEACGGVGFTLEEEKRKVCDCILRTKIKVYLRKLLPLTPVPGYASTLDMATHEDNLLIHVPQDLGDFLQLRWIFSHLLLRGGIRRTYNMVSAYDLVAMKLGDESYEGVGTLNTDILGILYGFHEIRNSLLGEILLHVLDKRASKGRRNWIFLRGTPAYSRDVEDYASMHNYEVVDLRGKSSGIQDKKTPDKKTKTNPQRSI